jgi:DNA polymerase III subunit alpha
MNKFYQFECGCKFPVLETDDEFPHIDFIADIEHISLECAKTWDLISEGNTKGCFQLESRLGQSISKKLKPSNIEQLSALISILRPGCLEAFRNGKSVTNHYIDKKNGAESVDYYHDSLKDILNSTYGEMIYQEQAMQITQKIAGFDLQEADMLRKAIGKKKPEEMAKVKKKFLSGCEKLSAVNHEQAIEIFTWIEKSQRYSFNKSHAISYAMNAYLSAYAKAHFPKIFFASYLRFAKDKIDPQQEIKELTRNALEMDVFVSIPDLRNLNKYFVLKNKKIYFGLTDIKGVGESVYNKILTLVEDNKLNLTEINWVQALCKILLKINSTAAKALISCGALDFLKKSRTEMLFEYDICSSLTKKELEYFTEYTKDTSNLIKLLQLVQNTKRVNKNRKEHIATLMSTVHKPPYSLIDKIEWLSDSENSLLGVAITCSKLDTYNIEMTNTNCKDFKTSVSEKNIILAAEISNVNVTKTKKGKNPGLEMCFVSGEDQYGMLDSIIMFPDQYAKYKEHLYSGNVLIFIGNRSKAKDSLIVDKCFAPTA